MKKNKKLDILITLFLIGSLSIFLGWKTLSVKKTPINKGVLIQNNRTNKKQFAMFIKNSENNQYETYEGDSFPEGYIANLDKSICTDINGNIFKDIISNSDNGITVTSNKTVYCEIYLDKKPPTAEDIANIPVDGVLESTGVAQDELKMRYYGTNPPNYICFGTKDKNTCINDTDKYMYRIIGIDQSNRFKVIKKEALNTEYAWHNSGASDINWPQIDLYKNLNGSYFLSNSSYVPSGWSDKIETMAWKYGDITNGNQAASAILQTEQSWITTTSAKIGLMYIADYYYAYQKVGLNCSQSGQHEICKTSWMHLSQNDSTPPNTNEWVISRYGHVDFNNSYYTWYIFTDGWANYRNFINMHSVRPVFYIVSTAEIKGTGTLSDPYLIIN